MYPGGSTTNDAPGQSLVAGAVVVVDFASIREGVVLGDSMVSYDVELC